MKRSTQFVCRLMIRVVIPADAVRTECFPGEVKQFPSDLDRGEIKEVPDVLNFGLVQGSVQPHQAVLKNVVRLHPAAKAGPAVKHFPSELEKAAAGMVEQRLLRSWVSS